MTTTMEYHNPVLLKESVMVWISNQTGYVDVTLVVEGILEKFWERLGPEGKLYAFDQDQDALANTIDDERFVLINENFRFIKRFLRFMGQVLMEFRWLRGFFASIWCAWKGFSTRFDAELIWMNQKVNKCS
jgi:16S rRNA (cytosine1402-N4)-methyltransferase